ncbi:hypothetical protein QG516_21870 [Pedobacter gandavensis]|uniref:hypothetical protein n=1 Tax=Pedobacter TaxID=84567 RepID=UPI001C99518F|nr:MULTISPECIES: hypothetical protein [Pedobacter]WGQ09164.1 hypothetical protein QG516_21870 [Pedobacter gandavensis]
MKYQQVKTRFDQVAVNYSAQMEAHYGNPPRTKAFKFLEKEYDTLKNQLKHLPGKPG